MNFGELILNEPLVKCFASTTPETDSETNYCDAMPDMPWVDAEVARKLERERDEAREHLAAIKHYLTKERDDALAQIVQAECRAERFCQERDEAREALENHMAATIHTCHDECKRPMCVLRRERDEAREEAARIRSLLGGGRHGNPTK